MRACRTAGHAFDVEASHACLGAVTCHDSAPEGVIVTTKCFISGWSLCGL